MTVQLRILVTIPLANGANQFLNPALIGQLENMGQVIWNESDRQFTPDEIRERLPGVDVCLTGWGCPRFEASVLDKADRLRLVAHTGGSVAPIVSEALFDRGVRVISGNLLYAESVAEGVIAYLLCALRRLPEYALDMKQGGWQTGGNRSQGLLDQTVGLVGFGMVSKFLAQMLKPFRVTLKVYDPFTKDDVLQAYGAERADSLDALFSSCPIVSLHAPKTPATDHMIDGRLLSLLPDGAVFVNTARGSLVDETALIHALRQNRIRAILDVYETEPLPADSPFRAMDNVLLIPHMAGPTVDRRPMVTQALLGDITGFFSDGSLKYEISRQYAMAMTQ